MPFWAFGNGAASYIDGHRFSRPRDLPVYTRWVDRLTKEGWGRATSEEATTDGVEGGKIVASSEEPLVAGAAEEKVSVCFSTGRWGWGSGGGGDRVPKMGTHDRSLHTRLHLYTSTQDSL